MSPSETSRLWRTIQLPNGLFWFMQQIAKSPNIPKSAISFDFDRYSKLWFSTTTSAISSIEIPIENPAFVHKFSTKENHCFSPLQNIPNSRSFPEKIFTFDFYWYSTFIFHQNYRFHLFDQRRHRKPFSCGDFSDKWIIDLFSLHQSLDIPKTTKSAILFQLA